MDETLMILATDVRAKTLKILDGLTEPQALYAAPGMVNSILWHAGHSLWVVERMAFSVPTGQPHQHPADWSEKFCGGSKPAEVKSWPKLAEVVAALKAQQTRLAALIPTLSEDRLQSIPDPTRGRSLRWMIVHGLQDEAGHQGEMWLLKKLVTKAS